MLVAVLLLGVLAFITSADRSVSWVESTLGSVFQPVQTFAAKASNSIIGFFQRIFKTSDADKELEQLQVRVAMMMAKNSMLCGMMAKNGFTASAVSA